MDRLDNPIRHYAWGSRTVIAAVQGRPVPTTEPEAELWMGAHPGAPSRLVRDGAWRDLTEVVAAAPEVELGRAVAAEHGPRLPFLLKLLAAEQPLSIQTHPDADQARAGFAAEEAAGIPRDDPRRTYVDPHHKPELLCAVTEFSTLCGFRDPAATLAILDRLDVPLLDEHVAGLRERPDGEGLRAAVTALLRAPEQEKLVERVVAGCRRFPDEPYRTVADLGARHPGDGGVLIALLMNVVRLAPREAIFVPAGMPHAYLHGAGMEVLASSDNVVRGGLTPKHVDVEELLRLLRFTPGEVRPLPPEEPAPGVRIWRPPVREFVLTRADLPDAGGTVTLDGDDGPRILFCFAGTADLGELALGAGEAAYVRAGQSVTARGDGVLFQATTA